MRIIMMLLESLIAFGLGFVIFNSVRVLIKMNEKKVAWNEWLKKVAEDKNVTEDSLVYDIQTILKVAHKNIPNEAYQCLLSIEENVIILKNSPKSLEQIKSVYPDDFFDLLNILHKYIPESLNKYFSIPDKMKKQTHRNGKNADDLLNEAFVSIQHRFEEIVQNLVSEKINDLKTYQSFIHKKFD